VAERGVRNELFVCAFIPLFSSSLFVAFIPLFSSSLFVAFIPLFSSSLFVAFIVSRGNFARLFSTRNFNSG
jgi:hypothetical protein